MSLGRRRQRRMRRRRELLRGGTLAPTKAASTAPSASDTTRRQLMRTACSGRDAGIDRVIRPSPEQRRIAVGERVHELLLEVGGAGADRWRDALFVEAPRAIDLRAQPVEQVPLLAPGPHGRFVVQLDLGHEQSRITPRAAVFLGSPRYRRARGLVGAAAPDADICCSACVVRTAVICARQAEACAASTCIASGHDAGASGSCRRAHRRHRARRRYGRRRGSARPVPARSAASARTPAPARWPSTRRSPLVSARSSRPRAARSASDRRRPLGDAAPNPAACQPCRS